MEARSGDQWMENELDRFIQMTVSKNGSGDGFITTRSYAIAPREEVLAQWEVVTQILARIYPDWRNHHLGNQVYEFHAQRDAAIIAKARLKRRDEVMKFLAAPVSSESTSEFHRIVQNAAKDLWKNKHRREAVQAAATAVENYLQEILGRNDCAGAQLVREAFSSNPPVPGKPRLRLGEQSSDDSKNQTAALRGLGEACFLLIRNRVTHSLQDLDEDVAREALATLSYFCRQVDMCVVEVEDVSS